MKKAIQLGTFALVAASVVIYSEVRVNGQSSDTATHTDKDFAPITTSSPLNTGSGHGDSVTKNASHAGHSHAHGAACNHCEKPQIDRWNRENHNFTSSDPLKVGKGSKKIDAQPLRSLNTATVGNTVQVEIGDQTLTGTVNLQHSDEDTWLVGIELENFNNAVLYYGKNNQGTLAGGITSRDGSIAYELITAANGETIDLIRRDITDIQCGTAHDEGIAGTHAMPLPEETATSGTEEPAVEEISMPTSDLQSLPGSPNVLYLDFDGEVVTGTVWNTNYTSGQAINATASVHNTDTNKRYIWSLMAEDYRAFNINVTTNRAIYDSATTTKRMMVVFTQHSSWYGQSGGVAFSGTFGNNSYKVCWVFTNYLTATKAASIAGSHEAGHTLGLSHDGGSGTSYYTGHGTGVTSWGPIMGAPYSKNLVTWDKGTYAGANNVQNDLQVITNRVGSRLDSSTVASLNAQGTDEVAVDAEFLFGASTLPQLSETFTFTTAGGTISLSALPYATDHELSATTETERSNLDLKLEILNSSNQVILTADGAGSREAHISGNLSAGNYTARVTTTTVSGSTGYPTYGQMGLFSIIGTIPANGSFTYGPSSISSISIPEGQPATQTLVISNATAATKSYSLAENAPWLSLSSTSGNLTSGQALNIQLNFNTAGLAAGNYSTNITLNSSALTAPVTIPVSLSITPATNNSGITIPVSGNAYPSPSQIQVGGIVGGISTFRVKVNGLSHGSPRDIHMLLVSPSGKKIMLMENVGGENAASNLNLTFSSAGNTLTSSTNLTSSNFRPSGSTGDNTHMPAPAPAGPYTDTINSLTGDDANGNWSLYIYDDYAQNGGSISSWSLEINTAEESLNVNNFAVNPSGTQTFNVATTPGKTYALEKSKNLSGWNEVIRTTASQTQTTIQFEQANQETGMFYRVKLIP